MNGAWLLGVSLVLGLVNAMIGSPISLLAVPVGLWAIWRSGARRDEGTPEPDLKPWFKALTYAIAIGACLFIGYLLWAFFTQFTF